MWERKPDRATALKMAFRAFTIAALGGIVLAGVIPSIEDPKSFKSTSTPTPETNPTPTIDPAIINSKNRHMREWMVITPKGVYPDYYSSPTIKR